MRPWRVAAVLIGAAAVGSAALAQGPNAADAYRACAERVPAELREAVAEVRFTVKGASVAEGSPAGTWEKVSGQLRANQAVIADLVKATKLERCEFTLPKVTSKTTEAEFKPVLELSGNLRLLARLLRADAARCWSEKDAEGAVDRVVALYGLCAHGGRTSLVITALVDDAIIGLANDMARTMAGGADGRTLTAAQKKRIRAAMDRLDAVDPAGLGRVGKVEGGDDKAKEQLEKARTKLMQDLGRTRQALGAS